MSLKNPVTPPGIDPGTVRLVAQRLNRYATPGPTPTRATLFVPVIKVVYPGQGQRNFRVNRNLTNIKFHRIQVLIQKSQTASI